MPLESGRERFLRYFPVSRETMEKLDHYEHLLQHHGKTLSLVGRSTLDAIWERHFLDTAQLHAYCKSDTPVIDIGSGAGFPGMILSILGLSHVHLVENNQQKVAFLKDVAAAVAAPVTIHNVKVEALAAFAGALVTARALAPLERLLDMGQTLFHNHCNALFLKGKNAEAEVAAAQKNWDFTLETFPSITSSESSILRLRGIRRKH